MFKLFQYEPIYRPLYSTFLLILVIKYKNSIIK